MCGEDARQAVELPGWARVVVEEKMTSGQAETAKTYEIIEIAEQVV